MKRIPICLKPVAKDYIWGGSRLNDDYNFGCSADPFAEAWVCSTHPDGLSFISSSSAAVQTTLLEYLRQEKEMLGSHVLQTTGGRAELPIIIKLIDAKYDLSVQVHPDDEYALRVEGELGKTEMCYVLDAKPSSNLIFGFKADTTAEEVRNRIKDGNIAELLNRVPIHRNDVFMVKPGTVHAIGAGALVAEIQESSNTTYRLYDYDRGGKDGKKRELHIEKALEVAILKASDSPRQPMRVLRYKSGCASELLMSCQFFRVERLLVNTEVQRDFVRFQTGPNSFHVLLCIDGCGSIIWDDDVIYFFKGDCIFVPADSSSLLIHGKAQFLNVSC